MTGGPAVEPSPGVERIRDGLFIEHTAGEGGGRVVRKVKKERRGFIGRFLAERDFRTELLVYQQLGSCGGTETSPQLLETDGRSYMLLTFVAGEHRRIPEDRAEEGARRILAFNASGIRISPLSSRPFNVLLARSPWLLTIRKNTFLAIRDRSYGVRHWAACGALLARLRRRQPPIPASELPSSAREWLLHNDLGNTGNTLLLPHGQVGLIDFAACQTTRRWILLDVVNAAFDHGRMRFNSALLRSYLSGLPPATLDHVDIEAQVRFALVGRMLNLLLLGGPYHTDPARRGGWMAFFLEQVLSDGGFAGWAASVGIPVHVARERRSFPG